MLLKERNEVIGPIQTRSPRDSATFREQMILSAACTSGLHSTPPSRGALTGRDGPIQSTDSVRDCRSAPAMTGQQCRNPRWHLSLQVRRCLCRRLRGAKLGMRLESCFVEPPDGKTYDGADREGQRGPHIEFFHWQSDKERAYQRPDDRADATDAQLPAGTIGSQ